MSNELNEELTGENAAWEDFHDAMIQIEMLFQSHILSFGYKEYTLENYADKRIFPEWKAREGCRDTDEMRAGLNIDGILRSGEPSEGEALTYVQYVINIAELCRRTFNREQAAGYDFDIRNYTLLLAKIRDFLKRLHYDYRYVEAKEFIFIVPHDAAADAAIPDEPSDPLYGALTEYRSTSASGDLARKKALLVQLGAAVESYPDNLKEGNNVLYSRIEFLLHQLGILETEDEAGPQNERIMKMSESELENWYDEAYRMVLLRILNRENVARMERVDDLALECGTGIEEVTEEEIDSIMDSLSDDGGERAPDPGRKAGRNGQPEKQGRQASGQQGTRVAGAASSDQVPKETLALYNEETAGTVPAVKESDGKSSGNRNTLVKYVVAIAIADILFILFLMYYFHLI